MKQIYLVNKSKAVLGLFSGVKSRITLTQPLFKHYCVLTVALMLLLGGFSTRVWGNTAAITNWSGIAGDSVTWIGNHVVFKLSGSGMSYWSAHNDLYTSKGKTFTLTWRVNKGCTINVTKVKLWGHTSLKGYVTVGTQTSSNMYNISETHYTSIESQALSLGNSGSVSISTSAAMLRDPHFNINKIEVTYTITPDAPTATQTTQTVYVTLNSGSVQNDEKIQLNTSTFFTMPGGDGHFYSYLGYTISAATGSDASKASVSSNYFSATKVGTYYVKANIKQDADDVCHKASGTSTNANTINVVRHPSALSMNDGEVFVKVNSAAASQKDLDDLIGSYTGNGGVTYKVISDNKAHATIGTGNIFSATVCGDYTIEATKAQTDLYAQKKDTFKVTVKKITPAITTNPTASAVVYQQTLATSTFTGGEVTWNGYKVTGSFSWGDNTIAPSAGNKYAIQFTPSGDDAALFNKPENVNIDVPITPIDQEIVWNLLDGLDAKSKYYEYATGEEFDAVSYKASTTTPTGLTIVYAVTSNSTAAHIVDGNQLYVDKVGEIITVTATCEDAAGNWNAATAVTKTFKTCGAKPNNFTAVTATNLTYGQLLSESELTGAVKLGTLTIPGTLEWVNPSYLPNAGNNQSFDVRFTPDDTETYGSVTFQVTINVAKANPSFNWNVVSPLRASTHYSNFFTTNSNGELTITTSSLLSVSEGTLITANVNATTTGEWVKISQAATTNFNALPEQTLNVTINPKSSVCLPIDNMTQEEFNGANAGQHGAVSWCNTNNNGTRDNYIGWFDVTYTQHVGIALGTWEDGLTGLSWKKLWNLIRGEGVFSWSTKYIDLSFTGIPDMIEFDVVSQAVTSSPPDATWPATAMDWYLFESPDGSVYTQVGEKFVSGDHINRQLQTNTRYVRIRYDGNFTGFVKNLTISQKKYLNADKSSLTFGTNTHPLQEPQTITLSYSSLGTCETQNGAITASVNNAAFYVDEPSITSNVGIDQMGEYTIRVRCDDVNQSGTLTFEAYDGTKRTVDLNSTKPDLTSTGSSIFQTGTEHAQVDASAYRTLSTIDYTKCFDGSVAKFDTLYLYGVTESSASERIWENDVVKGYKVPALNVAEGNVYTPCFVYAKNNNKYEYVRTCDATKTLNVTAAGEKLGFIGYRPASLTTTAPAIQLNGAAGEQTEVYLDNTEIVSNSIVLKTNSSSDAEPFEVKLYAHGTNILSANGATVQMNDAKTKLTIEDNWAALNSGLIALRHTAGYPSIDLAGANNVTINGSKVELHNATNMAIAHMSGATELTDGSVIINDGTILGDAILGMPQSTLIDGGTFNSGNVVCYNSKGKVVRPFNSNGDILSRQTMSYDDLVTNYGSWYGHSHLTLDGANVYPMLFGGEGLCIFEATIDDQSDKPTNWTTAPEETSDAIVAQNMEVNGTLEVNSLTINEGVTVTVKNGATLIVGDGDSFRETAGNLHVENGGKVQLTTGELIVKDFILDAELGITEMNSTSASASGQVKNENKLRAYGDACFRLKLDPSGRNTLGWYDFVVPFEVDVIGGISIAEDPDAQMKFNVNYAVMSYSESKRAVNGKDWNKFQGTMQPGRVYTIGLDDDYDWNTVVFKKKAGAALTGNRSFTTEYSGLGADVDNGWNGFGNGTLHHTELDVPDGTLIQLYDHSNRCYQPREAKDYTIAVGLSFFMQFDGVETVELANAEGNSQFRAPAHYARTTDKFRLALTAEGEEFAADNMWVSANEDATGEYVIGRDVLKMGTMNESKVARMWSERNGIRLCSNEMVLNNSYAVCDLTLYAPKAQQYTLSVEKAPEDAMLYLTYEGRAIWNLSYSPYVFDLAKGTTEGYGLKLYANPAPQVATGVDDLDAEAQTMRKVMIDNVLYIITPDGAMYDVTGKSVK